MGRIANVLSIHCCTLSRRLMLTAPAPVACVLDGLGGVSDANTYLVLEQLKPGPRVHH